MRDVRVIKCFAFFKNFFFYRKSVTCVWSNRAPDTVIFLFVGIKLLLELTQMDTKVLRMCLKFNEVLRVLGGCLCFLKCLCVSVFLSCMFKIANCLLYYTRSFNGLSL